MMAALRRSERRDPSADCAHGDGVRAGRRFKRKKRPARTEPGGLIRRALERFGGYLVDDTACNRFTVSVEWGLQERYAAAYPHLAPFEQNSGPFFDDLLEAFQALHVVANNAPETPGGGGGSGEPPPPRFCPPWES